MQKVTRQPTTVTKRTSAKKNEAVLRYLLRQIISTNSSSLGLLMIYELLCNCFPSSVISHFPTLSYGSMSTGQISFNDTNKSGKSSYCIHWEVDKLDKNNFTLEIFQKGSIQMVNLTIYRAPCPSGVELVQTPQQLHSYLAPDN